jgi:hypothetical protein
VPAAGRELKDSGHQQASQVLAVTAIELIIRYLLIRPLLQGAFLSDEWASFITQRITSGRSAEDRKLLPKILKAQGIAIEVILRQNGRPLWETIISDVYKKRQRVVHDVSLQPWQRRKRQSSARPSYMPRSYFQSPRNLGLRLRPLGAGAKFTVKTAIVHGQLDTL